MRFSRRKIRNSTPFRPMVERLEERAVPAIITVNSVADNDVRDDFLTLREAIMLTDRDLRYEDLRPKEQDQVDITVGMPGDPARTDIINFNIGNNPDQVQTITLTNDLPAIKHTVRINGYTQGNAHQNTLQYGDDAVILVVIDGARHDGIAIRPADDGTSGGAGSTIWGLAIVNMGHAAIVLATDDNSIQGNFLGTSDGITRAGNLDGIDIFDSSRNEIGGVDKSDRNIISGNRADGVLINGPDSTSNRVLGNYIGTEADGVHALANGDDDADPNSEGNGVKIEDGATSNSIGALTLGSGNVISGNKVDGILIDGSFTDANRVAGNFIGLDKSGQIIVANGGYGIEIRIATPSLFAIANEIGATPSPDGAGRNVISGNGRGGILLDSSDGTVIQGNYIGTNKDGTEEKANVGAGILLVQSSARIEQNVISGNTSDGVNSISNIPGPDTATTLSKNYIGTTADGTGRLGNHRDGVAIAGGGQFSVDSNVISANDGDGVSFRGVSNSSITNNYIGRDKNGNGDLHNGGKGIRLDPQDANKTSGNKVIENKVGFNLGDGIYIASGPDNDVESNWVFANHGSGIVFDGTDASGQSLIGNFVGVDDQGDTLGNLLYGVCVIDGAADETIGGASANAGNTIANNGLDGIYLDSNYNLVVGNFILGNTGNGVTVADGSAFDTIGGLDPGDGNTIANNGGDGVFISGQNNPVWGNAIYANTGNGVTLTSAYATYDLVQSNSIGIGGGNGNYGIAILDGAGLETIGGSDASLGNIIAGSGLDGLYIAAGPADNVITWNTIVGNTLSGIHITGQQGNDANLVQANYIGLDAAGDSLGNGENGIAITDGADGNQIGDGYPPLGNWIANNGQDGVYIASSAGNRLWGNSIYLNQSDGVEISGADALSNPVLRNYIGTDPSGANLGNGQYGVELHDGAHDNWIGDPLVPLGGGSGGPGNIPGGDGNNIEFNQLDGVIDEGGLYNEIIANIIDHNQLNGVEVLNANLDSPPAFANHDIATNEMNYNAVNGLVLMNTSYNVVQANTVNSNSFDGIWIEHSAYNLIGGEGNGDGNTVRFNIVGIVVIGDDSVSDAILANSAYDNASGMGIVLNGGANLSQNYPVFTDAYNYMGVVRFDGYLDSTPNASFLIELFTNDRETQEGMIFRGSFVVQTNGDGYANFMGGRQPGPGFWLTATATDAFGNTSEYSAPIWIPAE